MFTLVHITMPKIIEIKVKEEKLGLYRNLFYCKKFRRLRGIQLVDWDPMAE